MSAIAWLVVLNPLVAAAVIAGARGGRTRAWVVTGSAIVGAVSVAALAWGVARHGIVLASLSGDLAAGGPAVSWTLSADAASVTWSACVLLAGIGAAGAAARTRGVSAPAQALGQCALAASLLVVLADDLALLFTGWALATGALLGATGRLRCRDGGLAPAAVVSAVSDLLLFLGILIAYESTGTLQVEGARLGLAGPAGVSPAAGASAPVAVAVLAAAAARSCVAGHVAGRAALRGGLAGLTDALRPLPIVLAAAYVASALAGAPGGLAVLLVSLCGGLVLASRIASRTDAPRGFAAAVYGRLVPGVLRGVALVLVHVVDEGLLRGWRPTGEELQVRGAPGSRGRLGGPESGTRDPADREVRALLALLALLGLAVAVLAMVEAPATP